MGYRMRKKDEINMYIDYKKSHRRWKRRRRRKKRKVLLSIAVVLVLALCAAGVYFAVHIKGKEDYSFKVNRSDETDITDNDVSDKNNISDTPNNDYANNGSESNTDNASFPTSGDEGKTSDSDNGTASKDNEEKSNNAGPEKNNEDNGNSEYNQNREKTTDNIGNKTETSDNNKIGNYDSKDSCNKNISKETDNRVPVKAKGIYVTSGAIMKKRDKLIEIADTTEINAMVIDVKDDSGRITFDMANTMAHDIGATTNTIYDIEDLLKLLEEKRIYPIARIVTFKDPYLAEHKQEYAIKNKDGTIYRDNNGECWVNPYNKEVWDYVLEIAKKAAEVGFKEIQFDYIRFSTGKGISNADFGPLAEEKSKEEIITEFTRYAYENLKPLGVFVSADVYGTIINSSIDSGLVGQNYVEMAKYLDYICPMIYPSHFAEGNYGVQYPDLEPASIITKVLETSMKKMNQIPEGEHKAIVRPWLQDFTATWIKHHQVYTGKQVREEINAVYTSGYSEWLLWNAASNYSVDGLDNE